MPEQPPRRGPPAPPGEKHPERERRHTVRRLLLRVLDSPEPHLNQPIDELEEKRLQRRLVKDFSSGKLRRADGLEALRRLNAVLVLPEPDPGLMTKDAARVFVQLSPPDLIKNVGRKEDMQTVFRQAYPDPVSFYRQVKAAERAVFERDAYHPLASAADYFPGQPEIDALAARLYGDRFTALKLFHVLLERAREQCPPQDESERRFQATPSLKMIDPERQHDLLKRAEIHGHAINGQRLSVEILIDQELQPVAEIDIEGTRYACSKPYPIHNDRSAVAVYIEQETSPGKTQVIVRSFYTSLSQTTWRYLPDRSDVDGVLTHFGKGHAFFEEGGRSGEAALNAPSLLQEALDELCKRVSTLGPRTQMDLVFGGTARDKDGAEIYGIREKPQASFYANVGRLPVKLAGNIHDTVIVLEKQHRFVSIPPQVERMELDEPGQEPRFQTGPIRTWKKTTKLYGQVTHEVFLSHDNALAYLFCRNESGLAWLAAVEDTKASLTSNGLRSTWVDAGGLTMPAYEYKKQARGDGAECPTDHQYVETFSTHLSKIPLIQRYLASTRHGSH